MQPEEQPPSDETVDLSQISPRSPGHLNHANARFMKCRANPYDLRFDETTVDLSQISPRRWITVPHGHLMSPTPRASFITPPASPELLAATGHERRETAERQLFPTLSPDDSARRASLNVGKSQSCMVSLGAAGGSSRFRPLPPLPPTSPSGGRRQQSPGSGLSAAELLLGDSPAQVRVRFHTIGNARI